MEYLLQTPYKGHRHYIQGGDVFNEITGILPDLYPNQAAYVSKIQFVSFGYHLFRMIIDETITAENLVAKGVITLHGGDQKIFHLIETTIPPNSRVPYDEDSFVANASYQGDAIQFFGRSPFTTIETIIALTKALSYHLMPLNEGKWVFGSLELKKPLPEIETSIIITSEATLANRFSVNTIVIDGQSIGKTKFIVGTP